MALVDGARFSPYEIIASIGTGGMGEVYRARDTRLNRDVALKIIPAGVADNPVRRARFEREAQAISRLNHPNICAVYDVGTQDGVAYLVMEYIEGESLAQRVRRGPVPPTTAFTIDESVGVQCLDHLVYYRGRHAKEPTKICFGRWRAVNLRVVVNEREILALLGCEWSRVIE